MDPLVFRDLQIHHTAFMCACVTILFKAGEFVVKSCLLEGFLRCGLRTFAYLRGRAA